MIKRIKIKNFKCFCDIEFELGNVNLLDQTDGKYSLFRRHHGNRYHGYWDNTMPEKLRRKVDKCFG